MSQNRPSCAWSEATVCVPLFCSKRTPKANAGLHAPGGGEGFLYDARKGAEADDKAGRGGEGRAGRHRAESCNGRLRRSGGRQDHTRALDAARIPPQAREALGQMPWRSRAAAEPSRTRRRRQRSKAADAKRQHGTRGPAPNAPPIPRSSPPHPRSPRAGLTGGNPWRTGMIRSRGEPAALPPDAAPSARGKGRTWSYGEGLRRRVGLRLGLGSRVAAGLPILLRARAGFWLSAAATAAPCPLPTPAARCALLLASGPLLLQRGARSPHPTALAPAPPLAKGEGGTGTPPDRPTEELHTP